MPRFQSILFKASLLLFSSALAICQTPRIAALMGSDEIVVNNGQPVLTGARFQIIRKPSVKGAPRPFSELNKRLDAKLALTLKRTGTIFKKDELSFNSVPINTGNRRITLIRQAYYFEGGILAVTQPRGDTESDGPVEIMFVDLQTLTARFIPYGSKIYWPLRLVEIPSEYITQSRLTSSSTRTPPALPSALSHLPAFSAPLSASVQAWPVSLVR